MVSIVQNGQSSSKITGNYTVEELINMIRKPSNKEQIVDARKSGKKNELKNYKVFSFGKYEPCNFYTYIKMNTIAATWSINAPIGSVRRKADITDDLLSGFIYYDIDNISYNGDTLDDLFEAVIDSPRTYAAWHSFGRNGLGILVKVKGLTTTNFTYNWTIIGENLRENIIQNLRKKSKKLDFTFDAVTKDITRINILSYDENAYLVNDDIYFEYYAEEDENSRGFTYSKKQLDIDSSITVDEITYGYCEYFHDKLLKDSSSKSDDENRLTYYFYQKYFSTCNIYGISEDDAMNYLILKSEDEDSLLFNHRGTYEVELICAKQYNTYNGQFGSWVDRNEYLECYDIEDVNIKLNLPKQQINFLLKTMFYDCGNRHKFVDKEKLRFFIKEAKFKGIMPHHVIEFLSNDNLNLYIKFIKLVDDVYKNPFFPFGVVGKISEKEKKNKKVEYIRDQKNNSLIVNEFTPDGVFYEENFDFSFNPNTEWHEIIIQYVKEAVVNNISQNTLYKHIFNKYKCDYEEDLYPAIDYLYNKYSHTTGVRVLVDLPSPTKEANLETYILSHNQYVGDIVLPKYKQTIIWGDTNIGKTTLICTDKSSRKIILCPVIPLVKSIQNTYQEADVFYGDHKTVNENSNLIVCTYKSYKQLIKKMYSLNFDLSTFELHVDEAHYFASASSKKYMNQELNYITTTFNYFKSVTLWSGTWLNIKHPSFNKFKMIRVKKPRKKVLTQVYYSNRMVSCEKLCVKGMLNIVYLQSKRLDQELGKYTKYFEEKGWDANKMLLLNSNVKTEEAFLNVIKEEEINGKYELIFCTSVAAEGLNFNNTEVASLHFASNESPHIMEQMANRFRKTVPKNMYVYKDINALTNSNFLGYDEHQNNLIIFTQGVVSFINTIKNYDVNKIMSDNLDIRGDIMNGFDIDYLSIANKAFEAEKIYANQNIAYMIEVLSEYGWELNNIPIVNEEKVEQKILNKLKTYRKTEKDKMRSEQENILKYILENETLDDIEVGVSETAQQNYRLTSNLPDFELIIRKKILFFSKYMSFDDAKKIVNHWVTNTNCSQKYMKTIIKQLNIKENIALYQDEATNIDNKFYENLIQYYLNKKGKTCSYYASDFMKIVNKLNNKKVRFRNIDNALEFMRLFTDVKTVTDERGGVKYQFGAVLLQNEFSYQHTKIRKFIDEKYKSGEGFTQHNIVKLIRDIKRKTILGSFLDQHSPVDFKEALSILESYADISPCKKGFYHIENPEPLIFKDIELNFKKRDKNNMVDVKDDSQEFILA